jgi:hypothetical protein
MRLPISIMASLDGVWQKFGAGYCAPGVFPQGVGFSKSMPGGAATLDFTLQRDTRIAWPDLRSGTPVMAHLGGMPVWSGQLIEASATRSRSSTFNVSCKGYIRHLQEDVSRDKIYVISDLTRWQSISTAQLAVLSGYHMDGVQVDGVGHTLAIPENGRIQLNKGMGVFLDMGPNNTAKRIVCVWESSNNWGANCTYYCETADGPGFEYASDVAWSQATPPAGPTTSAGTGATARRYAILYWYWVGADTTPSSDIWIRNNQLMVFTDTAYESGNASILKASQILTDLITNGGSLLSTDTALIATTTNVFPEFYTDGYESLHDIIERANQLDQYDWVVTNEPTPRLKYSAPQTSARWRIDVADDAGASPSDTISDVYNRIRIRYVNTTGAQVTTTFTPTSDSTILAKLGQTRTLEMELKRISNSTAVALIGAAALATYSVAPGKDSITVRENIQGASGGRYPVGMIDVGDLVILNRRSGETGAMGRTQKVTSMEYDHDTQTTRLQLGDQRSAFDRQLARYEATGSWRR